MRLPSIALIIESINLLVQAIVAYCALKGIQTFERHRQQQKSKAAWQLLALFEDTFNSVSEIAQHPELYQYPHVDEHHMYTHSNPMPTNIQPVPARPSRLLYNKAQSFKKNSFGLLAQLGNHNSKQLKEIIDRSKKSIDQLAHAIYAQLSHAQHANDPATQTTLHNYATAFDGLLKEAEAILYTIIDQQ